MPPAIDRHRVFSISQTSPRCVARRRRRGDPVAVAARRRARRRPGGCGRRAAWPRSTPRPAPGPPSERSVERTPSSVQTVASATACPTATRWAAVRRRPPRARPRARCSCRAGWSPSRPARWRAWCGPASSRRRARPTRQSSGTNTSSRKTSLNSASPVISRSGRTSMPGALHVDQEVADALVLRRVRVGAGQADAPVGALGDRGPHLLAGELPAAVDPLGAGAQRGQVGAGAGLGEQLAPDQLAEQRRPHEPLALLVGAVLEDRRQRPAGDHDVRPGHARRAASSWSMTIWVTGSAPRPYGAGQCGVR